jgi:hypothetical protein
MNPAVLVEKKKVDKKVFLFRVIERDCTHILSDLTGESVLYSVSFLFLRLFLSSVILLCK